MNTLYPVVLAVPAHVRNITGREKVVFLSRFAREALKYSADLQNIDLPVLEKDTNGTPVPVNDIFWSISHKPEYVAGVVAPSKTGIDIEKIRPVSGGLFQKTAQPHEWSLSFSHSDENLFFRYWTAKEAVLKAVGTGIADLLKCQVYQIPDDNHMVLEYKGQQWWVEHVFWENHIAAVVQNDLPIQWIIRSSNYGHDIR
jgi:4'-phosphopantetheinyl transferase